jgi:hypothetical protein
VRGITLVSATPVVDFERVQVRPGNNFSPPKKLCPYAHSLVSAFSEARRQIRYRHSCLFLL